VSDEMRPGEAPALRPTGIYEPWCEHVGCKTWGSRGYSRNKLETHWFCLRAPG
jgi:hypothetical protein